MMLTETQAREKWCPAARMTQVGAGVGGVNRVVDREDRSSKPHYQNGCMCVASDCMWWRWGDLKTQSTIEGYCGMAGNP